MSVPVVQFVVAGQTDASAGLGRPYTLVFDGTCRICNRLVSVVRKWDRENRIEIVPSQAPGVQARFPWIPAEAYSESVQMIGPGGETTQGAAAVEQVLDVLPKGRLITWIFSIPGARPIAERTYRWVARNRYKLGCGEHCTYRPQNLDYKDNDPERETE